MATPARPVRSRRAFPIAEPLRGFRDYVAVSGLRARPTGPRADTIREILDPLCTSWPPMVGMHVRVDDVGDAHAF